PDRRAASRRGSRGRHARGVARARRHLREAPSAAIRPASAPRRGGGGGAAVRRRCPLASLPMLLLVALGASGCGTGYVARAAYEEARILWRRQPIETILQQPSLEATQRKKLELVLAVRKFAAERVGLRVGGSYNSVSEIDNRAVVQLLVATPRDSLDPYTWW